MYVRVNACSYLYLLHTSIYVKPIISGMCKATKLGNDAIQGITADNRCNA